MIQTWPEIQTTAKYFTDNLLVRSKASVTNGCTYYTSSCKPEASKPFTTRPRQIALSDDQRERFRKELERQLWLKLLENDNWKPEHPDYGRGYRCISIRLLHKRAQLFDRFEKIDNKTSVNQKKNEIMQVFTQQPSSSSSSQTSEQSETVTDIHQSNLNSLNSMSSRPPSSRSSSIGRIDPNTLPKLEIHDLGTHVYIDPIIISTFKNSIDVSLTNLDRSRQYVEVLRYIDKTVIDGKHEMMLWLDPGLVEIQHVWLEARDWDSGNPNSSRDEVTQVKNEVIFSKREKRLQAARSSDDEKSSD